MTSETTEVVGCDVARGTWVAVVLQDGVFARALVAASLTDIANACPSAATIAVDIPIGLPDVWPRAADQQARDFVGLRRNSVFFTPLRAAVLEGDYKKASAAHHAATGKGISRQAHGLSRMILDAEPVATTDERIYEGHPEASFRAMANADLQEPKTSWNGLQARIALLGRHGIELPDDMGEAGRVRPDDVVDAAVPGWTDGRILMGTAKRLGDAGSTSRSHAIYV
jgi:predicted RNase H-like nuclease